MDGIIMKLTREDIIHELIAHYLNCVNDDVLYILANNIMTEEDAQEYDRLQTIHDWCIANEHSTWL